MIRHMVSNERAEAKWHVLSTTQSALSFEHTESSYEVPVVEPTYATGSKPTTLPLMPNMRPP